MKIGVVGTGYVGLVAAACFAENGNTVIGVDIDEAKIKALLAGQMPLTIAGLGTRDVALVVLMSRYMAPETAAAGHFIHVYVDRVTRRPVELPEALRGQKPKLYGLTITAERLREIRQERRPDSRYAELDNCRFEIDEAEKLMRREGIRCINSTSKSIEEIATTILRELRIPRHVY